MALVAGQSAASSSDEYSPETNTSPLYDYRYNQAAEDLGILDSGASESKLSYGSITTASLNPEDDSRLSIKQADSSATSSSTCSSSCSPSCGLNSCAEAKTCGNTCIGTCSSSCSGTCGTTCGQTYGGTCARSCSSTCTDTCGSNTCGRDTCSETCSASCGLASCGPATACGGDYTCGQTCSASCGGSCGYTCYNSCYSTCTQSCAGTCIRTCSGTCGDTCYNSCGATCSVTCSVTCSNTCASTCANTCARTCANTCASTCAFTCIQTCSYTCSSMCVTTPSATSDSLPLAKSSAKTPPAQQQNALMAYDVQASPPVSVYYYGVSMPWSDFNQSFSGQELMAWIEMNYNMWGTAGRAPKGTWVRQFVYVPASGDLVLYRTTPSGITNEDLGQTAPGYKYVWFYAQVPGTYESTFNMGGVQSNNVTISVY